MTKRRWEVKCKEYKQAGRQAGNKQVWRKSVPVIMLMPDCNVTVCAAIAWAISADCFALVISFSEYLLEVKNSM